MKMFKPITIKALGVVTLILLLGCKGSVNNANPSEIKSVSDTSAMNEGEQIVPADTAKPGDTQFKVIFIELGSVRCIPCQKMQVVMRSIEEKFGDQVNVVFYDVWTPEGRPYGQQYGIQAIPTQVFLDENGKEFFRHEGYFPEEELVKVLNEKGVR